MTRSPGSPSLELPGRRPPSQERRSFRVPVERVGTWQRCLRWKVPVQLVRSMSMCGGAANNITATFACHRRSLLSRCGSAAPCLLAPFSERGELVPTAGIPARCARHLAAGHAQPCSGVCVVCGTCASHPAAPAEQGVPTAPLHRLLTWP